MWNSSIAPCSVLGLENLTVIAYVMATTGNGTQCTYVPYNIHNSHTCFWLQVVLLEAWGCLLHCKARCVSVSHAGIVSKRLNLSQNCSQCLVAPPCQLLCAEDRWEIWTGFCPRGRNLGEGCFKLQCVACIKTLSPTIPTSVVSAFGEGCSQPQINILLPQVM